MSSVAPPTTGIVLGNFGIVWGSITSLHGAQISVHTLRRCRDFRQLVKSCAHHHAAVACAVLDASELYMS